MRTVPEIVEQLVRNHPLLEEGLRQGIINLSAYARQIKGMVEKHLSKPVTEASILMALRRMEKHGEEIATKVKSWVATDISVRSHLVELTYSNSPTLFDSIKQTLQEITLSSDSFLTITRGMQETTLLLSQHYAEATKAKLISEHLRGEIRELSAITIGLPKEAVETVGLHYTILKQLAWEGINIIEEVSTYTEFTIVVRDGDVESAFRVLKRLSRQEGS